jgi:sigma-E factor negative regulatory protein RseA
MNDALKIQISAFVDGELPAAEAELLTRRLSQDADLRRQAGEYFAIGRLMRGERRLAGGAELRNRIAAAIAAEEQVVAPLAATSRWQRPAAGVAIAASVALLALVGLQQLDAGNDAPVPGVAAISADAAYTEPAAAELVADRPGEMLMQYYRSHGASSGELGANGILSRLVTLELRGGEIVEIAPLPEMLDSDIPDEDAAATPPAQEE